MGDLLQDKNQEENIAKEKYVDLEKVIRSKSERTWNLLPGFIFRYLKRIIHEDELNVIMHRLKHFHGLEFVNRGIEELGLKILIQGQEYLPVEGKYIIASNHPLGGPEGLALMSVVGAKYANLKFIVNDVLLNLENIKNLFVPVNKHGANTRESIRIIDEVLKSQAIVLTFPFGLVSRKRKGKIEDLEWKKAFINWAKKYERDIIPVFIDGRNSNFFYNLANIRKALGIKVNIEMLYLVNEMFKHRNGNLNITFGTPIHYKTFDNSISERQWAESVRKYVYQLANNPSLKYEASLS